MKVGKTIERTPITHTATVEQLYDILGTIDYLPETASGVPDSMRFNAQWDFDMRVPRYRLFDEIGMAMGGRLGEDEGTKAWATRVAKAYIACVRDDKVKDRNALYDCIPEKVLKMSRR